MESTTTRISTTTIDWLEGINFTYNAADFEDAYKTVDTNYSHPYGRNMTLVIVVVILKIIIISYWCYHRCCRNSLSDPGQVIVTRSPDVVVTIPQTCTRYPVSTIVNHANNNYGRDNLSMIVSPCEIINDKEKLKDSFEPQQLNSQNLPSYNSVVDLTKIQSSDNVKKNNENSKLTDNQYL